MLTIGAYRDLGKFWLSKEDLFDDKTLAGLAQADSGLSTFFGGMDFGRDLLGAIDPRIQVVLVRQGYDDKETPAPDIKLPAGAIVARLKDAKEVEKRFKIAFQSIVGIANIQLANSGQPQLEFNTEKMGAAKIASASFLVEDEDDPEGLINYNFSPSIAFAEDYFVLSSTVELARELVNLVGQADPNATAAHTRANVNLQTLADVLEDNEAQLVAQNALEKGHSREAAKKEISTLLQVVKAGQEASLRLVNGDDSVTLEVKLSLAQ